MALEAYYLNNHSIKDFLNGKISETIKLLVFAKCVLTLF